MKTWESTLASLGIFSKDSELFNIFLEKNYETRNDWVLSSLGTQGNEANEGKSLAPSHTAMNGNIG